MQKKFNKRKLNLACPVPLNLEDSLVSWSLAKTAKYLKLQAPILCCGHV